MNRKEILSFDDTKREELTIPEWNDCTVYIHRMSARERDAFELAMVSAQGRKKNGQDHMQNIRARFAVYTVHDAEGKRIFEDGDVDALGNKSGAALDRIFEVSRRLNKFSSDDIDELKKS